MSFNPPKKSPIQLTVGQVLHMRFSYSNPNVKVDKAILPRGLFLENKGVNPWFVVGTVQSSQPSLDPIRFTIRFTFNTPDSVDYPVTIDSTDAFACNERQPRPFIFQIGSVFLFDCAPNNTLLGDSIGNNAPDNYALLVRVNRTNRFLPIIPYNSNDTGKPSPDGLYIEFNLNPGFGEQITATLGRRINPLPVVNIVGVPSPAGYNFSFELNKFKVTYDFNVIIMGEGDDKSIEIQAVQVRKTTTDFSSVTNDEIMDGPGDPGLGILSAQIMNNFRNGNMNNLRNGNMNNYGNMNNLCDASELPRIILKIETDSRGDNNSEYIFSVIDKIKYDDGYYCQPQIICSFDEIYETKYTKYPQIQKVLKGLVCKKNKDVTKGTLRQKIEFLIREFSIGMTYDQFLSQLSFYAAIRYILSRFLYGKFSTKFLLEKYYEDFLKDLVKSRFRRFIILFVGPIPTNSDINFKYFYKYFLYDINDCKDDQKICQHLPRGIKNNEHNHKTTHKKCEGNTNNCRTKISHQVT